MDSNQYSNLCRACGQDGDNLISLFTLTSDLSSTTLAEAFTACTGLLIQPQHDPTTCMCLVCVEELKSSYKFFEKCKRTDDGFKSKIANMSSDKVEDPFANNDTDVKDIKPLPLEIEMGTACDTIFIPVEDFSAENTFTCNKCYKEYCSKSGLEKHLKKSKCSNVSMELSTNEFDCKICNKSYKNRDSYRVHMKLHSDEKFDCEVCGKSFPQLRYLKTHRLVHDPVKRHKCKNCKAAYTLNTYLRRHLRTRKDCRLVHLGQVPVQDSSSDDDDNAEPAEPMEQTFNDDFSNSDREEVEKIEIKTEIKKEVEDIKKEEEDDDDDEVALSKLVPKVKKSRKPRVDPNATYECDICNKVFTKIRYIRRHVTTHRKYDKFKCLCCNASYKDGYALARHFRTNKDCSLVHYAGGKNLPEKNRDLILKDLEDILQNPTSLIQQELKYKCDTCSRKFRTTALLKRHCYVHVNSKDHKCDACGSSFVKYSSLRGHWKAKPECQPADFTQTVQSAKIQLVIEGEDYEVLKPETKGGKIMYSCKTCSTAFTNIYSLRNHVLNHKGIKAYQCTVEGCKKGFLTSNTFRVHMNRHLGLKPYQCKHCGKTFYASCVLRRHEAICKQSGQPIKKHLCVQCGKMYKTKLALRAHQALHEEPKHVCELCGKKFYRKIQLDNHQAKHLGIKSYTCDICKKSYQHKKTLQNHLITHSDKPVRCHLCYMGFETVEEMRVHRSEVHIDILSRPIRKDHICPVCNKGFPRSYFLEKHMSSHADADIPLEVIRNRCKKYPSASSLEDGRQFECNVCQKRFKYENSLQIHVQKIHDGHFKCTEITCAKLFSSENGYKKHMSKQHNINLYKVKSDENNEAMDSSSDVRSSHVQPSPVASDDELQSMYAPRVTYKEEAIDMDGQGPSRLDHHPFFLKRNPSQ